MNTKILALVLVLGVVGTASAVNVTINIQQAGTYTGGTTGPFVVTANGTQFNFSTAGATVSGLVYSSATGAGSFNVVTSGLSGVADGTSKVNFTFGATESFVGNFGSMTSSAFGVSSVTGGGLAGSTLYTTNDTKAVLSDTLYAGPTSGTLLANSSNSTLRLTLATPVPEPSAFAALGVGAVALLRRRRKA